MPQDKALNPKEPARPPEPLSILAIGLESRVLRDIHSILVDHPAQIEAVPDRGAAEAALGSGCCELVLVALEDGSEEELAEWTRFLEDAPGSPRLVALVDHLSIRFAFRASQLGVLDVLTVPLHREPFLNAVGRLRSGAREVQVPLPSAPTEAVGQYDLVGQSPAMQEVYKMIARLAPTTATVLVLGESGTGKELVARSVHEHGPRSRGPFVAVNCAAIPENLLESELFGHEKGAFTGAVARKIGKLERASGGTLFLDEIADMSLALQAKILRAIQEREIEPVGSHQTVRVDVRLIAATNRDLREAMARSQFREDLYYRLSVVTIRLPRLADRGEDVLLLAAHFLHDFGTRYGKQIRFISDGALELLHSREWIGNVRELRNAIEHAVLLVDDDTLRVEHLPKEWRTSGAAPEPTTRPLASLKEVEARHIGRVLAHTGGKLGEAAEILGIHRNTLSRKIREYSLSP